MPSSLPPSVDSLPFAVVYFVVRASTIPYVPCSGCGLAFCFCFVFVLFTNPDSIHNTEPRILRDPILSKIPSCAVTCTEHRSRFRLDRSGAPNLAQINFLVGYPGVLKTPLPRAVRALAATIVGSTANNNSVDRKVERAMGVSSTSSPRALHGVKL